MQKRLIQMAIGIAASIVLFAACTGPSNIYKPGTYEGSGQGYDRKTPIRISITIDESGAIYDCRILEHDEVEEIGGKALDSLRQEVIEKNGKDLDTVSGATRTSEGFRQAVKEALDAARQAAKNSEEDQ